MAISVTRGEQLGDGSFGSLQTMTQSTATTLQTISNKHAVVTLGMGTATGDLRNNRYLLSATDATEGKEITVQTGATGEASLHFTGTATGALTFQADGDLVTLKLMNGTWLQQQLVGATLATATE